MKKLKKIWIFSDSIKGHEIQSRALACQLSDNISIYHCTIRQPWLSFAPRILPRFGQNIVWKSTKPNLSKAPDLIISCGRRMAAVAKYYKRKTNTPHVQILNPGDSAKKYDVLVCPQHDKLTGSNIITTLGSLHGITNKAFVEYKESKEFENSVVLLLGNPEKKFFTKLDALKEQIDNYFTNQNLIVCGSRRTPKKYDEIIRQTFNKAQKVWLSKEDGENPYMSLLAQGSIFIVTADSINMVSEACATDKPVVAIAQNAISPKHKRFISSIKQRLSQFDKLKENNTPLKILDKLTQEVLKKLP